MNYLIFVVGIFLIELIYLIFILNFTLILFKKYTNDPFYKNLNSNTLKLKSIIKLLSNIFVKKEGYESYDYDIKMISVFVYPFLFLGLLMIFSAIFGDIIFFYEPVDSWLLDKFYLIFKYIFRILILTVSILVIFFTFSNYNKLKAK